jgi:hypothetical protein
MGLAWTRLNPYHELHVFKGYDISTNITVLCDIG